jgi:aquaporin Z
LLKYLVGQGLTDTTGALGSNSTATVGTTGSFIIEVVLTFIFVGIILLVTKSENVGFAGLTIGLGLAAVHLVGIPMTGTSVNPARSFGPAILTGGSSLSELWVFIAAPLVGGLIAAIVMPWMASQKADA